MDLGIDCRNNGLSKHLDVGINKQTGPSKIKGKICAIAVQPII